MKNFDIAVFGGGIIGLATALHLSKTLPDKRIVVIEKEQDIAHHQSGHNSGVLHSGIYYKPGSEKARNCRRGIHMMKGFAEENAVPFKICGKIIVATRPNQLSQLELLHQRGLSNGVTCRLLSPSEVREREPYVNSLSALLIEDTGIIDYPSVCFAMRKILENRGCTILCHTRVISGSETTSEIIVNTNHMELKASYYIAASGLHSDKLLASFGHPPPMQNHPLPG